MKGHVADRGIVPLGDQDLVRVAADAVFNPGRIELVASGRVETAVRMKPRIAVRRQGDVAKRRNIAHGRLSDVAADVAVARRSRPCQRHAHADQLKAGRVQLLDRRRVVRRAEEIQTVRAMRPAPVEHGVPRRRVEARRNGTRDRETKELRIPRQLFTQRSISHH